MAEGGEEERAVVPGVIEAADYSMVRWHRDEAQRSRLHYAAGDAKIGDKGRVEEPY